MFRGKNKNETKEGKALANDLPVNDVNDLIRQNEIDANSALLIFDRANAIAAEKVKLKTGKENDQAADEMATEIATLIQPLLMQYDLTDKAEYEKIKRISYEHTWAETNHEILYKYASVQGVILTLVDEVREEQQQQRALKACEKAKAELLAEIKETKQSDHQSDASNAYNALDGMSKILERTNKTPKQNLSDFNKELEKTAPLIEKNRNSMGTRVLNVLKAFFLTLTVIGIPSAYRLVAKTKGEMLTEELHEATKKSPPRPRRK